jgi:hypothetical protein
MKQPIMKRFLLLTVLSTVLFSFRLQSDDVIKAFQDANAEQVAQHFDSFVDLKLPDKDEIKNMGKNQATIALKSFFEDNKISGFDVASQREMGGTRYIAGKLKNSGKGYNITIMLKKQGDKYQIMTVRIL